MTLKALFIPVDAKPEPGHDDTEEVGVHLVELPEDTSEQVRMLQFYVEGWIETVPIQGAKGEELLMWVNEEGRVKGLARNYMASMLAHQVIAGPVVVTGPDDGDGNVTALDQDTILGLFGRPAVVVPPESAVGPFVMVNMGDADGLDRSGMRGGFLKSFDPEAHNGRGVVSWTRNLDEARLFETQTQVWSLWHTVPRNLAIRPDGRPNKPLTAWHIMVQPRSDFEGVQVLYRHIPEDGDHRKQAFRWN